MLDHLDIAVVWTAARTVTVHVVIEPDLHEADEGLEKVKEDEPQFEPTFDSEVLESRPALLSFLESITRAEPDSGRIEALCLELNLPKLLEVLEIVGPPPPRILVPLKSNG